MNLPEFVVLQIVSYRANNYSSVWGRWGRSYPVAPHSFTTGIRTRSRITWRIRRITLGSADVPAGIDVRSASVAKELGYRGSAELRMASGSGSPYLAGLFRPVFVLPERMVRDRDETELSAVLAHELSHMKSRDIAWLLLSRAVFSLLWFHPLAWRMQAAHGACGGMCSACRYSWSIRPTSST